METQPQRGAAAVDCHWRRMNEWRQQDGRAARNSNSRYSKFTRSQTATRSRMTCRNSCLPEMTFLSTIVVPSGYSTNRPLGWYTRPPATEPAKRNIKSAGHCRLRLRRALYRERGCAAAGRDGREWVRQTSEANYRVELEVHVAHRRLRPFEGESFIQTRPPVPGEQRDSARYQQIHN